MKKQLAITITSVALVSGLVVGGVKATTGNAEDPVTNPDIIQTVKHQAEELDNHEARITNMEGDVKDLQTNTGTSPSTNKVSIPTVTTPSATTDTSPPPTPAVTIVSYKVAPEGQNEKCVLTYSDGTTHSFYSKQVDGLVTSFATCDDSLIGKPKQNTALGY